ncbi:MAG: hypothetical protein WCL14_05410 [Bacteroidota bacterium]
MEAREYIIKKIDELVFKFPTIRCRYEYDRISKTNTIEIVPNCVYDNDRRYHQFEREMMMEFIKIFPSQNICFINEDNLFGIEVVEYETHGILYNKIEQMTVNVQQFLLDNIQPSFIDTFQFPVNTSGLFERTMSNNQTQLFDSLVIPDFYNSTVTPRFPEGLSFGLINYPLEQTKISLQESGENYFSEAA